MDKTQKGRGKLLTVPEAADLLGVHPSTITRWVREGILESRRLPGGRLRFKLDDLEKLLKVR